MRWPLQPPQLCHPCITTIHFSNRFPNFWNFCHRLVRCMNSYQFIWAIGDAEIDVYITGHRSSLCGFQEWSPEDLLRDLSSLPSLPSAEGRRTNSSVQAAKCLQFLRFGSPEPKELDKPSFFKCILILTDSMCIQCDFGYIWVNYNIL